MVTPGDQIEMELGLVIDENKLIQQLKRVFGNMGELYTRAGGGGGGGGANEAGQVNMSKADIKTQSERQKVRTDSLKHLAQQFPGGGLMTSMASAFKSGGMMAGVATGISAAVGILTSIMKSSQIFQTLSGTVFKVLGFMADMFLMPFVPMMMKFVTWMLTNMPAIMSAGQKTADAVEGIWNFFTWGSRQQKAGEEKGGVEGRLQAGAGALFDPMTWIKGLLGPVATVPKLLGLVNKMPTVMQMGGKVPGGPGESVPTMLHGGEMVIPQDIAAGAKGMGGRVASWIERFQQKEMGPGGVIAKWYDEMFGHSIIPEMWGNIRGLFQGIETEADNTGRQVASATGDIEDDNKSFWSKLKFWEHIGKGWQLIKDCFNLVKDNILAFFTFSIDLPNVPKIDWGGLINKLKAVGDKLAGWSSKVVDFIVPDFKAPKIDVSEIWNCVNLVKNSITGFFMEKIPNVFLGAIGSLGSALGSIGSSIGNFGSMIWDCMKMIGGGIKSFFLDTIPNFFINAWSKASGWVPDFGNVGSLILNALTGLAANIKDKIMSIPGHITGIVGKLKFWQFGSLNYSYTGGVRKVGGGGGGGFMSSEELETTMGGGGEGDLTDLHTAIEKVEAFYEERGGSLASVNSLAHNADNRMTATVAQVTKSFENLQVAHNMANNIADLNEGGRGMGTPLGGFQMPSITEHKTGFAQTYYAYDPDVEGWAFGRLGKSNQRRSGGGGGNISNRTVNVSILSNQSVQDIVRDVERLDSIAETSFFNSVG